MTLSIILYFCIGKVKKGEEKDMFFKKWKEKKENSSNY